MTSTPVPADRDALAALAESQRALIASLQHPSGAYPASPTFSAYRGYSWFRDGAFIADAMSAAGEHASAEAFFGWCARVISARETEVRRIVEAERAGNPLTDASMLPTRFTLDGRKGADEWWDFQLDGYGLWLWALGEHVARTGAPTAPWLDAVGLTVEYLESSWRRPCYDWWEEHIEQVHVSTLGSMLAGLRAAAELLDLDATTAERAARAAADIDALMRREGVLDGHLVKWIGTDAVDASLAALVGPLEAVDPSEPLALATLAELESSLVVDGGMHRFRADTYFGGGQWPLLSCMLGIAWARAGRPERSLELLRWAASTSHDGGIPEQVEHHLLDPSFVDEWVERWGPSADPLVWSSAMFLRLAVELEVVAA
ncbi:glycoside hydrolase family 15 [Protaetiibacter sp. SSC-01]|uniref:glycoside hydrolase family 15 protein n=1 Tax=Protaetiibacter sp. SSC-01 TaxID=2759943 RepID=UPI001657232D|nr:glycoside hydrolase family 15 protein [Protaetiibacter sp. SSC-01]QNO37262.1 glycoside hydrolase family 15 [Protaetiibacter sp. SSC-01]